MITYENKENMYNNTQIDRKYKAVADDFNEIKQQHNNLETAHNTLEDIVGLLANLTTADKSSIVNAINEINGHNHITTDGSECLTGRIIDNKPEYVKRIKLNSLPNSTSQDYATGIILSNIIPTKNIDIMALSNSNNWFPMPNNDTAESRVTLIINSNVLRLWIGNANFKDGSGYADLYYIYKT